MTRARHALRLAALLAAATALIGFAGGANAEVRIDDAWARATIGAQRSSGAYMTITSDRPARLIAVHSPAAGVVEVHEMTMIDNIMRMRPIEALPLPAGQAVKLAPGGYHLMLLDLKAALLAGESVPLTLTVENDDGRHDEVTVSLNVRSPMPRSAGHGAPMSGPMPGDAPMHGGSMHGGSMHGGSMHGGEAQRTR